MKKTPVDPMDHMTHIMKTLKKAALISTRRGDEINFMTIAWGQVGIEWNRLIFTALVRKSRHTHGMIADTGEFAVNIPWGDTAGSKDTGKIMGFCGSKSGRDVNKAAELGLGIVDGEAVSAPGLEEVPLTLECRVIYSQDQDPAAIPADIVEEYYPGGPEGDYHTMFFGEILGAYIVE